ncbi:hypothetical protein T06_1752 [Trichinella sp. T6]|nr:hypothetical protein T06_1752 [Trichinella sp. T6]
MRSSERDHIKLCPLIGIVRRFRLGKVRYEWNCTLVKIVAVLQFCILKQFQQFHQFSPIRTYRFGLMKQQWMDLRLANEMFECVRITKFIPFQILSKLPN